MDVTKKEVLHTVVECLLWGGDGRHKNAVWSCRQKVKGSLEFSAGLDEMSKMSKLLSDVPGG